MRPFISIKVLMSCFKKLSIRSVVSVSSRPLDQQTRWQRLNDIGELYRVVIVEAFVVITYWRVLKQGKSSQKMKEKTAKTPYVNAADNRTTED